MCLFPSHELYKRSSTIIKLGVISFDVGKLLFSIINKGIFWMDDVVEPVAHEKHQ